MIYSLTRAPLRYLWLLLLALAACEKPAPVTPGPPPHRVTVAAAADLKFAFDQIAMAFVAKNPDIDVETTYGSSGTFATQIEKGAPFDLFLSADLQYPQRLIDKNRAVADSLLTYATGYIVIWTRSASPLDPLVLKEKTLLDPAAKKIAIANPLHAPYGRAAEAAMKKLGVYDGVKDKLVLGENIAQAAQFAESGNADVGIIALSLAMPPPMQNKGRFWQIPPEAYPPIQQAAVITTKSKVPAAAKRLRDFLATREAADILSTFGFKPEPPR